MRQQIKLFLCSVLCYPLVHICLIKMKYSLFFAATAAVISIAGASPAPAPIEPNLEHMNFDCNDIPSICANMCYGEFTILPFTEVSTCSRS